MNCNNVAPLITPYIDNEISDEMKLQIREHIEICDNCRREYELQSGVHRLLREKIGRVQASEAVRKRISDLIQKPHKTSGLWLFNPMTISFRPIIGLAAVFVIVIVSLFSISLLKKTGVQEKQPAAVVVPEVSSVSQGIPATVTGEIICVGCYLAKNFNAQHSCAMQGYHNYGIIDSNGEIWSFTVNSVLDTLIKSGDIIGKKVKIDCQKFSCARFISLNGYQFLKTN